MRFVVMGGLQRVHFDSVLIYAFLLGIVVDLELARVSRKWVS